MAAGRTIALLTAPLLTAGLLAGCSSHDSHGAMSASTTISIPADAAFDLADVTFAQSMIPHHQQAVEMAEMAIATSTNASVLDLARAIEAAQQPEIDTMTSWLRAWGQTVPSSMGTDHSGHDMSAMGTMQMDGMMSAAEMQRLGAAKGAAFDRLWLELMIRHHEGALTMARTELADGRFPAAKAMAEAIIAGQTAEIATMKALLTSVGG